MANDLKCQAEESLSENDPIFVDNLQRCYLNIPEIVLLYSDHPEQIDQLVEVFATDFNNSKLSIHQLHIVFATFSMMARGNNLGSENTEYFDIESTSKKCSLSICARGSLQGETNSLIVVLKRSLETNSMTLELIGKHAKKLKIDETVNKTYIRSLLDVKQGGNRDGVHKWKVLEESKSIEAILYSHVAYYSILKNSIDDAKLDKHSFICDTLINFAIVNNSTVSRHATSVIAAVALNSKKFFQDVLFARLCQKMIQLDESLHTSEREKSSDFILHPHKVKNIYRLISKCLHGSNLNSYNKSLAMKQGECLEPKPLTQLLIAVNSPAVYNFNEKGNIKYKVLKRNLDCIIDHYSQRNVEFKIMSDKISRQLVDRMATKMFMFSEQVHMRNIAINV